MGLKDRNAEMMGLQRLTAETTDIIISAMMEPKMTDARIIAQGTHRLGMMGSSKLNADRMGRQRYISARITKSKKKERMMGPSKVRTGMGAIKFSARMGIAEQMMGSGQINSEKMGLLVSNLEMMMPLLIATHLRPSVRSQLPLMGARVLF